MIRAALVFFALAAAGGTVLATFHLRGRRPPWIVTIVHGILASSGLLMLVLSISNYAEIGLLHGILALFFLVAGGGIGILSFHLRGVRPPATLVLAHGAGALTAFILLLCYALDVFRA